MHNYLKENAGFTLVELVVSMMLVVLLLSAVFSLLSVSIRSSQAGNAQIQAQEVARMALDTMVREIRLQALAITNPATDIQTNELSIALASNETVTFHQASGTLYRKLTHANGSFQNSPITEDNVVSNLQFTTRHPRTVTIDLTVTIGGQSYALSTTVVGLNTK